MEPKSFAKESSSSSVITWLTLVNSETGAISVYSILARVKIDRNRERVGLEVKPRTTAGPGNKVKLANNRVGQPFVLFNEVGEIVDISMTGKPKFIKVEFKINGGKVYVDCQLSDLYFPFEMSTNEPRRTSERVNVSAIIEEEHADDQPYVRRD